VARYLEILGLCMTIIIVVRAVAPDQPLQFGEQYLPRRDPRRSWAANSFLLATFTIANAFVSVWATVVCAGGFALSVAMYRRARRHETRR